MFVLDVSGSMNGFPIEKSKALARKAIAAMRPTDTFNFITFAGATSVLWPEPKPANDLKNELRKGIAEMRCYLASTKTGGALRKEAMSKLAAMRTGSTMRVAKPVAIAASASNQVSAAIRAAISSSDRPERAA